MTLLPWKQKEPEIPPQPTAFEELALPLLPSLYNVARWLARDPTDAEDLVQETVLKALRGFRSFELGTNFKAWIFRILRNTYLTSRTGLAAMRTLSLEQQMEDSRGAGWHPEATIDYQTPEINLMEMADRAVLHAAMEQLPPPMLEVLLLCDFEEMKYKDIATVLDIPIGTVMSRIARARTTLAHSLRGGSRSSREVRP